MSWQSSITLHVDIALGHGALEAESPALKLAIGTGTTDVSDARIGYGAIGSTQTAGYFTIGDADYGKIGVAGRIPGDGWDEAQFTALESLARAVTIRRSKAGRYSAFDTGTCSITFRDETRDLDPLNLDGPYVVAGTTLLTRGRRVRIYADWDGARRYLFTGFVDSWPSSLDMFEAATRTIECTDWFGLLALFDGYEQSPTVGSGETVTARIHRILDMAEIPGTDRDIGTSTITCAATTLGGNVLGQLRQAAATDGGHIWVAPDGRITFRSRTDIWTSTAANTVGWSATNVGADVGGTTCLYAATPQVQEHDAYSAFFLARDGGSTQTEIDTTLKDRIGWVSYERTDIIADSDAQVAGLGAYLMASQPRTGQYQVTGVLIRPDVHEEARALALTHNPFDRMSVAYSYPVSGLTAIEREGLITGVEHAITTTTWQTRLTLEDVTGFGAFEIGESAIGGDDFIP